MADFFKGLVDPNGRPIPKAEVRRQQAGPTVGGVRQPYGEHPAAGLQPGRLARLLRESIEGSPLRYLELAEDMEERDLHYAAVLSVRKRQVSGLPINVMAAGDDAQSVAEADLVREVIERDEFQEELVDILDSVGKGFSCSEIVWDTSEGQWMPSGIAYQDPRFFEFDRANPEKLMFRGDAGLEELKPVSWIVHRAKTKSGLTIRGGLARAVAWTFLFKAFTVKDWAIFCEAYGQPLRVGKFDPGASEKDKDILLDAVTSIGADFAAIIPLAMSIDFVKADLAGSHDLYEKRADWLDRQVSKVVLGQTATTDAIAGGHAVGKVHDRVRDDIEKSDARQLSATLTRDLAQPLVALNFGPRKKYPRIIIGRPEEEDIKSLVDNVAKLVPLGLRVGASTMRDKIGLPDPEPDEELLGAPVQDRMQRTDAKPKVPLKAGLGAKTAMATARPVEDSIDQAVAEMLGAGGWEPLVAGLAADLQTRLAAASTADEAKAILAASFADLDVAALTKLLANAMFAARLAGETGENL